MKVIGIGWNYPKHNAELGGAEKPSKPTVFCKPDSALLKENKDFYKQCQTLFFWAPKSLRIVIAAMKLKDAYSLEEKL